MSAKKRDEREPLDITWNAIPGKRCALCGQDFLDDGSINVDAAFADHMANVHPDTQSSLLTNRQATVVPAEAVESENPPPQVAVEADWPVWYRERREKAAADGLDLPELFAGETQKAYDERTGA